MILVIGGTSDSREIAEKLVKIGAPVLVSTATGYGAGLAAGYGIEVSQGRLDENQLRKFMASRGIKVLVDASHPYATEISFNSAAACAGLGIPYVRYARAEADIPTGSVIEVVKDYLEAARRACAAGHTIIAATGGKTAGIFIKEAVPKGRRIIFRIIPDPEAIKNLIEMGVSPGDIVAMQGPFSEEMNIALIRHYGADVMITKESGTAGGFMEKVAAAEKTGARLIVVRRPPEPEGAVRTVDETVKRARAYLID